MCDAFLVDYFYILSHDEWRSFLTSDTIESSL